MRSRSEAHRDEPIQPADRRAGDDPAIDSSGRRGARIDTAISLALGRSTTLRVPGEVMAACSSAMQRIRKEQPDERSLAVTSAQRREGRSTIAMGLALAEALTFGRRVVLVDLHVAVAAADGGAPIDRLEHHAIDPIDVIEWVTPDLGVLGPQWLGPEPPSRDRVAELMSSLGALGLQTVADLAPLSPRGNANGFVEAFDVVALVVRAGSTPRAVVAEAIGGLAAPPFVILNAACSAVPRILRPKARR